SYPGLRGGAEVLRDISLQVAPGEIIGLIGPSGCGKTTLFNILAGLVSPDQGAIRLDGRPVAHIRSRVAYMQQKDLLLPWRTALDNAILGMEIQGIAKARARQEAMALLQVFGLEGFQDSYPHALSGGMRQRVALMRTLLCRRQILLLDEPFGALDTITRAGMQRWLLKVWMHFRPSVLLVTHDVEEALLLADRIYILTSRPGTIKATISVMLPRPRSATAPELVRHKADLLRLLEPETNGATS
ncbi:MAG: ABC transporter ATP-binding protein, partial [Desulfobacterales bacterium]|nr:ABC transporter ATP-binding protein [Desulfobacterales bacterium]